MSGSSLDGIDFCLAEMDILGNFSILKARTVPLPEKIYSLLRNLNTGNYFRANVIYSGFLGKTISDFLQDTGIIPNIIAIHGHTFLHNPAGGYSVQLGDGEIIKTFVPSTVITNFRTRDIAYKGQGAPLVPVGEYFLFPGHKLFLNLGGIANFSYIFPEKQIFKASDICPANQILNKLAREISPEYKYDPGGSLARKGKIIPSLLNKMNDWDFYKQPLPKSLSNQQVADFYDKFLKIPENPEDKLRTFTEHIAGKIADTLNKFPEKTVFTTGGGAYNSFLIERINSRLNDKKIFLPEKKIIDFKEALIFAFLGLRKHLNLNTVFSSATGSKKSSSGGSVHY